MNLEEAKAYLKGYKYDNEVSEAIGVVLEALENKDAIINEMSKWLVGFTYSDEEHLEAIFNNKEEVLEYFAIKVTDEGIENYIDENTCLRCEKGRPRYCEDCFQEAVGINAKLQEKLNEQSLGKDNKDLVIQMEVEKFIKMIMNGTVSIDYSPDLHKYRFIDKNGNGIEVEPAVYLNIVNYIERGEIYD